MAEQYDVGIIGAGPGGYVAAIRSRQLGLKTLLVEKDSVGGVCLNWGCIPSKSLIHQSEIVSKIEYLRTIGITVDATTLRYEEVQKKSRKAASKLTRGVQGLIKKNKITYTSGEARIETPQEIRVDGKSLSVKNIIVATGSRPKEVSGFEFDEKTVLSSTGILAMTTLPKSLVILGSGAIGMEFAYVMNAFGVDVTVVEMLSQVLPLEDSDVAAVVAKAFTSSGVKLLTATKATKLVKNKGSVDVVVEREDGTKKTLSAEKLLVAVGRMPNTENLGLEALGMKLKRGFIPVQDYGQTTVSGIYAIGDVVAGTPLLAHVASKEGEIAVEHIAGKAHCNKVDVLSIPSAIYCNPQVGSFGLTEEEAKRQNVAYKVSTFPFVGVGKAVAINSSEGFVKILTCANTSEILGVHAVGYNATEIVHELLVARVGELLPCDIATMIHSHPTISEGAMEAARASEGWAIHI